MRSRTKWSKACILLTLAATLVVAAIRWRSIYWSVASKKYFFEYEHDGDLRCRGWALVHRWWGGQVDANLGPYRSWYLTNGFLAQEGVPLRGVTYWAPDGTLEFQITADGDRRSAPPWLWGERDEQRPSMPEWMQDEAEWRTALMRQDRWLDSLDR